MTRILIAGVGNIFLGDDGFGVEVVNRLAGKDFPPEVEVADFGIRGVHLAYQLLDGYEVLLLVDAMPRGEPAGTVTVLEPELPAAPGPLALDAHGMEPLAVLSLIGTLAAETGSSGPDRVFVVGCEPAQCDEGIGLSPAVEAAVADAVGIVEDLIDQIMGKGCEERVPHRGRSAAAGSSGSGRGVATGHQAIPEDSRHVRTRR